MFSRQLRQHVSCSWGTKSTFLSLLSALFVIWMLAAAGCSLGGSSVVAEALFQVSGTEHTLAGENDPQFNAREYELFQKTQLALVKSDFVLQGVIRDPAVASLSILASRSDKVAWLVENLEADFVDGSEVLRIALRGSEADAEDLRQLVDAVAQAYTNEVVFKSRQYQLDCRDALAAMIDGLRRELETKMERLAEKKAEAGDADPAIELDQAEVDSLLILWRGLVRQLEVVDLNVSGAPERIRQLQPAIIRTL